MHFSWVGLCETGDKRRTEEAPTRLEHVRGPSEPMRHSTNDLSIVVEHSAKLRWPATRRADVKALLWRVATGSHHQSLHIVRGKRESGRVGRRQRRVHVARVWGAALGRHGDAVWILGNVLVSVLLPAAVSRTRELCKQRHSSGGGAPTQGCTWIKKCVNLRLTSVMRGYRKLSSRQRGLAHSHLRGQWIVRDVC